MIKNTNILAIISVSKTIVYVKKDGNYQTLIFNNVGKKKAKELAIRQYGVKEDEIVDILDNMGCKNCVNPDSNIIDIKSLPKKY